MLPILINSTITYAGFLVGVLDAALAILLYRRRVLSRVLLTVAIVTSIIILFVNLVLVVQALK